MNNDNKSVWVIVAAVVLTGTGSNIDISRSIEDTNRHVDNMISYFEKAEDNRRDMQKALSILTGTLQQHFAIENLKDTECVSCHTRAKNPLPKGRIDYEHFRKFLTCEDRWYTNDMPCYDKTEQELETLYGYIYLNQGDH